MSTRHGTAWQDWTSPSTRQVTSFIRKYWRAFHVRRERQKSRTASSELSDSELIDIGTTRGENIASGIRSGEWLRYLPTVDGQIGPIDFRCERWRQH
ncbi:DUF1127 domain-containing protein [Bradyrhizobium macuxiense]|uniref:DUF1127 domain-containing protein n=1 Tax=Bradyrhizobium macuxiense TaxID=1755647 RepID=UPI0009EA9E89|nr:DUF1127 domain-containing protein [Bradyrhizobium macuxiense]